MKRDKGIVCQYGLVWFAGVMQLKLEYNQSKGGWIGCTDTYLKRRLNTEVKELYRAMKNPKSNGDDIAREAADVANFAMMIADNARGRERSK